MNLHDPRNIAGGDPDRLRAEAAHLGAVCDELATVAGRLRQVTTYGVWDSEAGETFAASVGEVPERLDAVRGRLQSAAEVLSPYASQLQDSQERMRELDDRYGRAHDRMRECDHQLDVLPAEAPERAHVTARRRVAVEEANGAAEAFERESDEAHAREQRLAASLSEISAGLDDPGGYNVFEGLVDVGDSPAVSSGLVGLVPQARFLAFAKPIGLLGVRAGYGQGSYTGVALETKTAVLNVAKMPERRFATTESIARSTRRWGEMGLVRSRHAGTGKGLGARARRAAAQGRVKGKHAAQDAFEDVTGIQLMTSMVTDWTMLTVTNASPSTKIQHLAAYSLAAVKKVDTAIGWSQSTADAVRRAESSAKGEQPRSKGKQKSVASAGARCER